MKRRRAKGLMLKSVWGVLMAEFVWLCILLHSHRVPYLWALGVLLMSIAITLVCDSAADDLLRKPKKKPAGRDGDFPTAESLEFPRQKQKAWTPANRSFRDGVRDDYPDYDDKYAWLDD